MVSALACHAKGCRFKSCYSRYFFLESYFSLSRYNFKDIWNKNFNFWYGPVLFAVRKNGFFYRNI